MSPHGETSLWFRVQRYDSKDCRFDDLHRFLCFSAIIGEWSDRLDCSDRSDYSDESRYRIVVHLFSLIPEIECKDTTWRKGTFSFVQFASVSFRIIQFISVSFSFLTYWSDVLTGRTNLTSLTIPTRIDNISLFLFLPNRVQRYNTEKRHFPLSALFFPFLPLYSLFFLFLPFLCTFID